MVDDRVRPMHALRVPPLVAATLVAGVLAVAAGPARAGANDLQLMNLCPQVGGECSWIHRNSAGTITEQVQPDAIGQENFRSLMSELGVVIAPRLSTPADTLGYSGFQFSFEMGFTKINADRDYWNGVAGVDPNNRNAKRPDSYLTTIGGFVRKGIWLPLPAFEFGAGALNVMGSGMYAVQGYAKLALQEGFHGWWLPSVAVRGSASQLLGTDQADLNVFGVDVLISKAFGLAGTARLEPFAGWSYLFIDASSGALDATPGCDAFLAGMNPAGTDPKCRMSTQDVRANFSFPEQDLITRQRFTGGFKLKLAVFFVVGEYALIPAGKSQNERAGSAAVRDTSGRQQTFSFSAGLDF
jgi:hypothetical protein